MSAVRKLTPAPVAAVWAAHAPALAAWAFKHMVNRQSAYGLYLPVSERKPGLTAITKKDEITPAILATHFRGERKEHTVGLHSTAADKAEGAGEIDAFWSRWGAYDIDLHDGSSGDAEANRSAAITLYDRLVKLGFHPLLIDSNGKGGFHLLVIFDAPVPTAFVYYFLKSLATDWEKLGLKSAPETFPKQAALAGKGFGNWIRLPGCHHTSDHWSRVWDGVQWLEGKAAIKTIVGTHGDPAALMPAKMTAPPPRPKKAKASSLPKDLGRDAQLAREALRYVNGVDDYKRWVDIGLCLTALGAEGLAIWDDWSTKGQKYQDGDCERKWRTFRPDGGLTLGTLFHYAKDGGWEGQSKAKVASPKRGTAPPPPALRVHTGDDGAPPETPSADGDKPQQEPGGFNRTDLGNARRLVARFGDSIRYVHAWKCWFYWDGKRWVRDQTGHIYRMAKRTVQAIGAEAEAIDNDDERKAVLRWALASESKKSIEAMIALAQSEPGIAVKPEDFDANNWLLNCTNGTIDLRTGELHSHRREDLITKLCPVVYKQDAPCPRWEKFEKEIFADDPDLIAYVRRVLGYCLTGDVKVQEIYILHGDGANGKNAFLDTVRSTLGDYASVAEPSLLLSGKHEAHPTGIADLQGRRFVCASETDDGKRMAESLVKRLTGEKTIKARRMHQDFFEFPLTAKILLATNHEPAISGSDHGIWRRIRMIPFNVKFVKEGEPIDPPHVLREIQGLDVQLATEAPGILALMVRACLEWQEDGMCPPEAVTVATEAYKSDMDAVGQFLGECCDVGDTPTKREVRKVRASALYDAFANWAKRSNLRDVIDSRTFGGEMQKRGFPLDKSNSTCWRKGLKLNDPPEDNRNLFE